MIIWLKSTNKKISSKFPINNQRENCYIIKFSITNEIVFIKRSLKFQNIELYSTFNRQSYTFFQKNTYNVIHSRY